MEDNFPLISVCIPVYATEPYLAQCLQSVYQQKFSSFEVIVVSDASCGKDFKGRTAKKIVKIAQKECDAFRKTNGLSRVKIHFVEHHENRGCVEVRRTLVYESNAKYIAMLDSDDEFLPDALSVMYEAAISNNADIVHGTFISGIYDSQGVFQQSQKTKCGKIFYGIKDGRQILSGWSQGLYNGNVCGKLIEKSVFQKAFEEIPYTECNMADDLLIFFFVSLNARRYIGIQDKVYRYRINSGMSSDRKIDSLRKWKLICTSSSVFSIISLWVKEHSFAENSSGNSSENQSGEQESLLSKEELDHMAKITLSYLVSNIHQMYQKVVPELLEDARQMLYDFWGESFVQTVEKSLKNESQTELRN